MPHQNRQKISDQECRHVLENFIFQRGDMGARLLSILSTYIHHCTYKVCPMSQEDKQEVLQEVSIKLLRRHKQLKGNCNGWLYTIVRNEYIDHLRKQSSRSQWIAPDHKGNLIEADAIHHEQVNSLSRQSTYHETDCLESVFDHIENQATGTMDITIYTGYAEGQSLAYIAEQTNRTVNAIGKRISNLRKRVRELREKLC